MVENDRKDCPFCAEPVHAQARICPHCRSLLRFSRAPDTYRNRPGRQIAGVSLALAEAFGISVTFVRLAFIVLTFVSFIGPPLYVALWLLLPAEPGGVCPLGQLVTGEAGQPSILERFIRATEKFFDRVAAWIRGETAATPTSETSDSHEDPAERAR